MGKRVAITLDDEQIRLIHSIKCFGKKEAEIVKNILLAYLSEKGFVDKINQKNAKKKK